MQVNENSEWLHVLNREGTNHCCPVSKREVAIPPGNTRPELDSASTTWSIFSSPVRKSHQIIVNVDVQKIFLLSKHKMSAKLTQKTRCWREYDLQGICRTTKAQNLRHMWFGLTWYCPTYRCSATQGSPKIRPTELASASQVKVCLSLQKITLPFAVLQAFAAKEASSLTTGPCFHSRESLQRLFFGRRQLL